MAQTESGLYVPTSVLEEMAEERALEMLRERHERADFPLWGSTRQRGTTISDTTQASDAVLLREIKGWAAISVKAIADRVAGLQMHYGVKQLTDDGKPRFEPDLEHPVNGILARPNAVFSGRLLQRLVAGLLVHTGQAYLQKLKDGLGLTQEIWPIPNQSVKPVSRNGLVIGGYEVRTLDGQTIMLEPDEVIRVWWPDWQTLYDSIGSLGPQALTWDAQTARDRFEKNYFENDTTPRTALVAKEGAENPGAAGSPERSNFEKAWRNANSWQRGQGIGVPAFLPPGWDVHEFGDGSRFANTTEQNQFASQQILAAYGVPQTAVGKDTNVNRSTAETAMYQFDLIAIKPVTETISDAYTTQWISPEYGMQSCARFEDFVAPDKDFELREDVELIRVKARSPDEARERRGGMPATEWDGSRPPGTLADVPYTGEEDETPEPALPPRSVPDPVPTPAAPRADRSFFAPEAVWNRNIEVESRFLGRWVRQQRIVFEVQRVQVLERWANLMGLDIGDVLAGRFEDDGETRADTAAVDSAGLFSVLEWKGLYEEVVHPLRLEIMQGTAQAVMVALVEKDFDPTGTMTAELERQGAQYVTNIDGTTQSRLADALAKGNEAKESPGQIARRLSEVFASQQSRKRLRTIARTEVGMANQAGQQIGFASSGVVAGKRWNSSLDGDVRPSHQINGQEVRLDQNFTLASGVDAAHPLDRSLPAAELVNCRCFMTPVLIGEGDE